jgi:hypothetical protein
MRNEAVRRIGHQPNGEAAVGRTVTRARATDLPAADFATEGLGKQGKAQHANLPRFRVAALRWPRSWFICMVASKAAGSAATPPVA